VVEAGIAEVFAELDARFNRALDRVSDGAAPMTLLYSGGVDSTLVALALRGRGPFEALVVGTGHGGDTGRARAAGELVGLRVREVRVGDPDVARVLAQERPLLDGLREPARSVQVAMALAVEASGTPRVLTGQGADELFGGYAHFRGLRTEALEARRAEDLDRLIGTDWPLSRGIAARRGHDLRSPFLDEEFVRYAKTLPLAPVGSDGLTKPLLRQWAVHRGVPRVIALEPKHAMQYGSGVAAMVRRVARSGDIPVTPGVGREPNPGGPPD
jgi:asparagine synthase (glutamine-hydrolysing)